MNEERGMMKYMPYQSLTAQAAFLAKMRYEKNKTPRPLISSDRAEEINEVLVNYDEEEVEARYWEDGYMFNIRGIIARISATFKFLIIGEKEIPFKNLIELTRI